MEKTKPQIDIRRNSTGSFGMKTTNQSVPLPNYLRASMGSCHDYCKYGIKRDITENVKTKNSTFQSKKEVIIQQKLKQQQQKAIIPKQPNELKMETLRKEVSSQPKNRRYSDVCVQTRNFTNGWSNDVKNAKRMVGVPKATTRSVKRDSKNALVPKGLPQSKSKGSKAKTKIEEQGFEIPVEKILYVDEIIPVKQHVCGIAQEEVESIYDHSRIQTLLSEERNDPSNLKALSLYVPDATEDMSYINVKALSLSVPQTEDMSYINVKDLSLYVPDETEDMSYVKALSLSVPDETEDMRYTNVEAHSLCVPDETEDTDYTNVKALSLYVPDETEDKSYNNNVKSLSLSSVTIISCEADSYGSSKDIEFKKDNNVDDNDDCESTETRNELEKVVLRHQNTEEKRLSETARMLVEERKNKVKALVSAFEALISLEDNKSLQELLLKT